MIEKIQTQILILLLILAPIISKAQNENDDSYIYKQRVSRLSSILEPWDAYRGEIVLTNDELTFTPKNKKNKGFFRLEYENLISVKRKCLIIFPNSIVITDKNYAKYKIGTYRRKEIVDIIGSKL